MSPNLQPAFLVEYARRCDGDLRDFLEAKVAELRQTPLDLGPAFDQLRDYVMRGGKRVRGALVLEGMKAGGGRAEDAFDASIGVELLHAYLLIHDDFMDRDEVRRGGPTIHAALGGDHLAGSIAILLGSLCQAWAWELILRTPGKMAIVAAMVVARALQEVTVGQTLDLLATKAPPLDAKGVLEMQRLKTGSYTFELPLTLGASLAGGDAKVLEALSRYARPLGQAFQIADDLLGTFGAPEVTGKPNASDLREGKRTMLIARALELAAPADAQQLRDGLGRPDADVEELRAILRRSGAADSARAEAQRLRDESLKALDALPAAVAENLRALAAYTVDRVA